LLQLLLTALLDVSSTLSPKQKVVGPDAVTVGAGGSAFTCIESFAAGDTHPDTLVTKTK